jgi:hypothetical protein
MADSTGVLEVGILDVGIIRGGNLEVDILKIRYSGNMCREICSSSF